MAVTIAYPSDPIDNGATGIQSTTFVPVAADYAAITHAQALNYLKPWGKLPFLPTGKDSDESAQYFVRLDLTGSSAVLRNVVRVWVGSESRIMREFSGAQGAMIQVPVGIRPAEVFNWYPTVLTLTDGTALTVPQMSSVRMSVAVNPETRELLYSAEESGNTLYEALGFVLKVTAATVPTLAPYLRAISGIAPLT